MTSASNGESLQDLTAGEAFLDAPTRTKRKRAASATDTARNVKAKKDAPAKPRKNGAKGSRNARTVDGRVEGSLHLLTKRFIGLFPDAPEHSIELNQAALALEVPKRRIYDITNVLEALSLVDKKKNIVTWGTHYILTDEEKDKMLACRNDLLRLGADEKELDASIEYSQTILELIKNDPYLFLTQYDLRCLEELKFQKLYIVHAPLGANMEVTYPTSGANTKYSISIRAASQINAVLVPSISELEESAIHSTPPTGPPLVDDVHELPTLVPDVVPSGTATPGSPMSPLSKIGKHTRRQSLMNGGPTPGSPSLALDSNSSVSITDSSNYDIDLLQSPGRGDDSPDLLRYPSYVDEYYLRFSTEDEGPTDLYFDESPAASSATAETFLATY